MPTCGMEKDADTCAINLDGPVYHDSDYPLRCLVKLKIKNKRNRTEQSELQ